VIPLSELKAWLTITDSGSDDLLTQLEARMVAKVEQWTGDYLGPVVAFTEILDGGGRDRLWLRQKPIGAPTISLRTSPADDWIDLAPTDIEVDGRKVYRKGNSLSSPLMLDSYHYGSTFGVHAWPRGCRNVRAVYESGFAEGDEPQLEKDVVMELVARSFLGRSAGGGGVASKRWSGPEGSADSGSAEIVFRPYKDLANPLDVIPRRPAVA